MCNKACIDFGVAVLKEEDIRGKSVIEVGSMDVNGSLRPFVESFGPKEYLGVDIHKGPGVDIICRVEDLQSVFGFDKFDIVICTEVLEHVADWEMSVHNLKQIVKPGGVVLITTRSKGFRYHGYPSDFWRYEISDIKFIFSDFDIKSLKNDPLMPGIFLFAKKPIAFVEKNISRYRLYSIVFNIKFPVIKNGIYWVMIILSLCKTFCRRVFDSAPVQLLKNYLKKLWVKK